MRLHPLAESALYMEEEASSYLTNKSKNELGTKQVVEILYDYFRADPKLDREAPLCEFVNIPKFEFNSSIKISIQKCAKIIYYVFTFIHILRYS